MSEKMRLKRAKDIEVGIGRKESKPNKFLHGLAKIVEYALPARLKNNVNPRWHTPFERRWTTEVIKDINAASVQELFDEYIRKSAPGEDISPLKIVPPEQVYLSDTSSFKGTNAVGVNYVQHEAIALDAELHDQYGEKIGSEAYKRLRLLHSLMHEEAHVLSGTALWVAEQRSGYKSARFQKDWKGVFTILNEGVTEKIARDIFLEYIRRNGVKGCDPYEIEEYENRWLLTGSYPRAVRLVEMISERIAHNASVPTDVVWNSIVRGYFRGSNLLHPELQSALSEVFDDDFLGKLQNASSEDHAHRLLDHLFYSPNTSPLVRAHR